MKKKRDDQHYQNQSKRMLMLTDGNIEQASARIRAIQYIPLLEKSGYDVRLIPRVPNKPLNQFSTLIIFPIIKRMLWIKRMFAIFFQPWDIVFIQRIFIPEWAMQKLKAKAPIIFDFDDAIYINDRNPSDLIKTATMIKCSNEIIISTRFLNDFCLGQNKHGIVIPTPVETDRIIPVTKDHHKILSVGWIGSSWTTDYLKIIEPVLQKLSKELSFKFLTVGARPDYRIPQIDHVSEPWSYERENSYIGEMDIGIMPLPDNDFARAKGGYKIYLYMAGGIPVVASAVGINQEIIRNGENGFLASNEEEWFLFIKTLLLDHQLRNKLGKSGRNDALKYYERTVCFNSLSDIFKRSIKK
jgi:glycosyltransferase involved in cell wall biosynthesis